MTDCRILIVEDHPLFRDGLRALLDQAPGYSVVGVADTADDAVELCAHLGPDVVVMDLALAAGTGADATKRILGDCPAARILVLTSYADDAQVFAALRAGAHSYLLKTSPPQEIVHAVMTTAIGDCVYEGGVAQRITEQLLAGRGSPPTFAGLTRREHDVLDLMASGHSNATIAARLVLSPKTVSNNVSTIFSKLGVTSRAEAVARARDAGLGAPPGNTDPG